MLRSGQFAISFQLRASLPMKVAVFNTKLYDRQFLEAANSNHLHEFAFFKPHLNRDTAVLASGYPGVCIFVNDQADAPTLEFLAGRGTKLIALRCAGFNNLDIHTAHRLGMKIVRVPAYSPYAVAEYTIGMILTLNRKYHRAYNRVREGNFSLDGLMGFDLHGRTVGIVGTGKIGVLVAQILKGFGCRVLAYDLYPNSECAALGVEYVELDEIYAKADIISLHCPLTRDSYHLIGMEAIAKMKTGVMLVNTSRGALIDASAVTKGLKSGKVGYLGLDVYEQESSLFFEDLSGAIIQDDVFQRLTTFPNVLITAHQAFFTEEALRNIAVTTVANITDIEQGRKCANLVEPEREVVV